MKIFEGERNDNGSDILAVGWYPVHDWLFHLHCIRDCHAGNGKAVGAGVFSTDRRSIWLPGVLRDVCRLYPHAQRQLGPLLHRHGQMGSMAAAIIHHVACDGGFI